MNGEDKFKKSLDDLIGQKEFPFTETAWEDTRDFIDAARGGKKAKPFIYIIAALLLLMSGIAGFYFLNQTPSSKIISENKTAEQVAVKQVEKSTEANTASDEKQTEVNEKTTLNNTNFKTPVTVKEENTASATSELAKTEITEAKKEIATERSTEPVKTKNKKRVKTGITKIIIPEKTDLGLTKNAKSKTRKEKEIVRSEEKIKGDDKLAANDSIKEKAKEKVSAEELKKIEAEKMPETVLNSGKSPESDSVKSTTTQSNTLVNEPAKEVAVINTASVAQIDTAALNSISDRKSEKIYNNILSVEGGMNYFTGWSNPGTKDARGFTPIVGINYSTLIIKKVFGTIGLNYYSVGNLSYSSITAKNTHYGLGEESSVAIITPIRLHYIGLPIKLNYVINKNHSAGIGCNIGYLLNVSAQTETYTEKVTGNSASVKSKAYGYKQGIRTPDLQLSLFYKRRIYKDLFVNAEFMYGLTDVKNNAFFNSNVFERNTAIRISLIYNFFKK